MFKRFKLNNGIRVIGRKMPSMRSVSIGIWVHAGSVYENEFNNGVSHFIEHMMFKGTTNRTAKQLAEEIDEIGGQINAFTSKECTCYYVKVIDTHIEKAVDVLSDMMNNSLFDEEDILKESNVIKEEINMYDDSPEDLAYDILAKVMYDNHELSMPILGINSTIDNLTRENIVRYLNEYYVSENIVISIAGSYEEDYVLELLNQKLSSVIKSGKQQIVYTKPKIKKAFAFENKDIEQYHLCIGYDGVSMDSDDFYAMLVLNNYFGGSTSSKLYQTIREDNGLAYSVYSSPSFYQNSGVMTIYCNFSPENQERILELIIKETNELKLHKFSEDELYKLKEQLKGSYVLGLESTSSIMNMLGKRELLSNNVQTLDTIIDKIDSITTNQIEVLISKIFDRDKFSMSVVGKIDEKTAKEIYTQLDDNLE